MEIGASRFTDLVGRGGCFILMAADFLSEAERGGEEVRGGVKFRVGKELDAGRRYENSHLREEENELTKRNCRSCGPG